MNYKHGLSKHPIYVVWNHMIQRCYNAKCKAFRNYGARGIGVCDEWCDSPAEFIKWCEANGWDSKLEIDRVDNNSDYSPENCRFVTHRENQNNKRSMSSTHCAAVSRGLKGHSVSKETREKLRRYKTDTRSSIETRLKQTRARGGKFPPGVQQVKNKFRARAYINGQRVSLGLFGAVEEAAVVYQKALAGKV